jgi:hypothetical protein
MIEGEVESWKIYRWSLKFSEFGKLWFYSFGNFSFLFSSTKGTRGIADSFGTALVAEFASGPLCALALLIFVTIDFGGLRRLEFKIL